MGSVFCKELMGKVSFGGIKRTSDTARRSKAHAGRGGGAGKRVVTH